eukprot:GHVN01055425.1.p1 GENE.GHVN01055425.1~~GHVN01055425.1.p1  ORF type:complete len:318 (+),score=31.52 GHVN01055425.1:25-954(+)
MSTLFNLPLEWTPWHDIISPTTLILTRPTRCSSTSAVSESTTTSVSTTPASFAQQHDNSVSPPTLTSDEHERSTGTIRENNGGMTIHLEPAPSGTDGAMRQAGASLSERSKEKIGAETPNDQIIPTTEQKVIGFINDENGNKVQADSGLGERNPAALMGPITIVSMKRVSVEKAVGRVAQFLCDIEVELSKARDNPKHIFQSWPEQTKGDKSGDCFSTTIKEHAQPYNLSRDSSGAGTDDCLLEAASGSLDISLFAPERPKLFSKWSATLHFINMGIRSLTAQQLGDLGFIVSVATSASAILYAKMKSS